MHSDLIYHTLYNRNYGRCEDYHGERHQAAYSECDWFKEQMYKFILRNKNNYADRSLFGETKRFLETSNCPWNETDYKNHFYGGVRLTSMREKAMNDKSYDPPKVRKTKSHSYIKKTANQIEKLLLRQNDESTILSVLNEISKNKYLPRKISQYPLGEQVCTIDELSKVMSVIMPFYTDKQLTQKEVLLASICILDGEQMQNFHIMRDFCSKSFKNDNYSKVKARKQHFLSSTDKLLFDPIINSRTVYPLDVFRHAFNFWISSTHPNPNPSKTRTLKDASGSKTKHPQYICYTSYKTVYEEWSEHETTIQLCIELKCSIPSNQWFQNVRPKFIYPVDDTDYSHCSKHANWTNINKPLLQIFKSSQYHKCGSKECVNYVDDGSDVCKCVKCASCPYLNGLFTLTPTKFIKFVSCNNNCKYSNLGCWRSECKSCGVAYLQKIFDGTLCSLSVPDDTFLHFDKHEKYKNVHSINNDGGCVPKKLSWQCFVPEYLNQYRIMAKHHTQYIYGFRTRRDWTDRAQSNIPLNACSSHFDYINSPKPVSKIKTYQQWSSRDAVSLLATVSRITCFDDASDRNGQNQPNAATKYFTKELQYSYFSIDAKHDWCAALYNVEVHIQKLQKYFQTQLQRTLTHFHGYSDRGEFSCSAFIVGLGHIVERLGLSELYWTFTTPEHGKSKCDCIGSMIKRCIQTGVNDGYIVYDPEAETYDKTIIRALNEKFIDNDITIERSNFSIPINTVHHIKQDSFCGSITDITEYFAWNIRSPTNIWRRYLDCKCVSCLNKNRNCSNSNVCGQWMRYQIPKSFIKSDVPLWIKSEAIDAGLIAYGPSNKND